MKIIENDVNEITLKQRGKADLNISFDYNSNYWLYSEMGNVNYRISAFNLNERSEYNSFHNLMTSLIGRYFMYEDDDREFWNRETKTISLKSDQIDYLGKTYEGATLELQLSEGYISVRLFGEEIEGKVALKIHPNKKNGFCISSFSECFNSLKAQAEKDRTEVREKLR